MPNFVDLVPQPIIWLGYGLAARFLGKPFVHYRPNGLTDPLVDINAIETINLTFDRDPTFNHKAPKDYANPFYYGLFDMTNSQIGDYLWDQNDHLFYIANAEPLRPPMLVRCNRRVRVITPNADSAKNNGYYGDTSPVPVITNWPAAIQMTGIGGPNISGTMGNVNDQGALVFLPHYVPIHNYDIVIDDLNRRYVVGQNELTALGWRLVVRAENV